MTQKEKAMELKEQYKNISLLEFSELEDMFKQEFELIGEIATKRIWKEFIYSLNMAEYKRDRIWEFLNEDITKEYFDNFVIGVHKGWFK